MKRKSIRSIMLVAIFVLWGLSLQATGAEKQKFNGVYGTGDQSITLATGSPGALGLLKALADPFCQANQCQINWTKKGSGASLKAMKAGKVDLVMVHAPAAEKNAVKEGWATMRTLLGSNEFYIVGPKDDPADIAGAKSAAQAYAKIAKTKSTFMSRGDNSGTHKKEMAIWKTAGIKPSGKWYIITKDFMMATLNRADKENGYFMVDSSTWVAGKKDLSNTKVLFKGDAFLVNTYHALCQPDEATYGQAHASTFIDFVSSEKGQKIIREYGKNLYGESMYNDANYAKQYDH